LSTAATLRFDGIAGFDCLHGTPRLIAQPKYQSNVNDLADGIIPLRLLPRLCCQFPFAMRPT
jgi:hypothetical protein